MASVLTVTLVAAMGAAWIDEFDSPSLHSRWQWRCPVSGPSFSLTASPGCLRITVPQRQGGFDHWVERDVLAAPMLTTDAPQGNFAVEARLGLVNFGAESNFHAAVVIGFSPGYVLAWGPFHAPLLKAAYPEPEIWCEPSGLGRFIAVRHPCRDIWLRMVRDGNTYQVLYRLADGGQWMLAGDYQAVAEPSFIGIMGKTFGDGPAVEFDVDYVRVEELGQTTELHGTLTVDTGARRWPLDDRRYAHFIEHMFRCIYGGLWAEVLDNRKFAGPTVEGVAQPWRRLGPPEARFSPDTDRWYVPAQSQRMELRTNATAGIAQGPLDLRGGVAHVGHVVAMSKPAGVKLRVQLVANGEVLSCANLGPLAGSWRRFDFRLPALPRRKKADFQLLFDGPGIVWLGAVSLMPADNLDGWRRDVVQVFRAVRPSMVRWPGGNFASQYDWRDGIGDRDRRPPRWNRAWGGWEWNDVGTDEFIRLCSLLGAEPYICLNAGEGTGREAAQWVEYCNGAASTPMGALRAAAGHPEPYGVKIWGLGNEMYGSWQHGHLEAVQYALKAAEIADCVRRIDRNIELVLVGVEGRGFGDWNEKVVALAGRCSDYLSVHHYTGVDVNRDPLAEYVRAVSAPTAVEGMLEQTWDIARRANGGLALPIAFDEWNVWRQERDDLPGEKGFYTLREALFAAEIFNILNRLGPKVPIACVTQTVNVLGLIRVHGPDIAPTPSYWVLKLFREGSGRAGLPVRWDGPAVDLLNGRTGLIDASATVTRDGRRVWVFLVNRHASRPVAVRIHIPGAKIARVHHVKAVTASDFLAANDYGHPHAVVAQSAGELLDRSVGPTVRVPAHSLVAVEIELETPVPEP
ncbi:MAG: hypothetical protein H5T86_07455 [Armatimonadetes bacterium]|nr:hypothetical protein [Armatimonadota bacterium]